MNFTTRTGNFPVGFRRGGQWQKEIGNAIDWAKQSGFGAIDVGTNLSDIGAVTDGGLRVGSADLLKWQDLFSPDAGKRADAVAANNEYLPQAIGAGAQNFFAVILPADTKLSRKENFAFAVESFSALAPTLEKEGGRVVIEGWPGPGALCCTPETYRALFEAVASHSIGINYDPSHLVRMGIDPIRFLKEFATRVGHVHGKDCAIVSDDLYEYGWEQPATFKQSPRHGSAAWRYTIPGQGQSNWNEICRILAANNYAGAICIELEDARFDGTQDDEQAGFITGAQFLSAC